MKKNLLYLFAFLGCERDIGLESNIVISGYRIEGRVIDRIGNPVANVDVIVFYSYEYVDYNTPPSKSYDVPSSQPTVTVVVRNRVGQNIRTLYSGSPSPGPFTIEWDKRDATGKEVPSTVYSVHYLVNGVSQKSYEVVVDGTIVVKTDSLGRYAVPNANLPVGFYPVPLYSSSNSSFYGNHRISSAMDLLFVVTNRSREVSVKVTKDRLTLLDVVIG